MPRTWFLRTPIFRWYAVRELSGLLVCLFLINLVVEVVTFSLGQEAWESWVAVERTFLMVVLAVLVLVMAIVCTVTWIDATPKILRIKVGTSHVPSVWIKAAHYVVAVLVLIALIWLVGGGR